MALAMALVVHKTGGVYAHRTTGNSNWHVYIAR